MGGVVPDPARAAGDLPPAGGPLGAGRTKTAVVTGGASGLGLQITLELARAGVTVVVVGRYAERLEQVADEVNRAVGRPAVQTVETFDLAVLSEVKRVGELLRHTYPSIDILVNNAGAVFARRELTVDGQERTFALNVLAPYALTAILAPSLARSHHSRVVNIASAAHRLQHLDFEDLGLARRYSGMRAYGRSKLAVLLLSREFARRLRERGCSVFAVHPGFVRTHFGQNNPGALGAGLRLAAALFAKSVERGADTPVFAALDPSLRGASGIYLVRRKVRPGSRASQDLVAAGRLFETCRSITGVGMEPDEHASAT